MQEIWREIPPVTRYYGIGVLALAIASLKFSPYNFVYHPQLVFQNHQFWRLITGCCFLGKLDLAFLMHFVMSFQYILRLEKREFPLRHGTFLFLLILLAILSIIGSTIFGSVTVGSSIVVGFSYIYSKLFTGEQVMVLMMIPVPIQYLPFVNILMTVMQNGSPIPGLIGIAAAHIVFYLCYILPAIIKRPILKTPPVLAKLNEEPTDGIHHFNPTGAGRRVGD